MSHRPTRSKHTALQQVCNLIPPYLVAKLARKHDVDKRARTFSPWSHVVSLLYAQLVHAIGLNDICDGLANHAAKLLCVRNATPPKRNTLSHANKVRDAKMAEDLFWSVLHHLTHIHPRFGGRTFGGFPRRFKRVIDVVDATTIQLVANCIDWASHRRRKAAAKMHLGLNLQSFLPRFAIVDTARQSDSKRARELCARMGGGEIVLFDKAYVDFKHLFELCSSSRSGGCFGLHAPRTTCDAAVDNACLANRLETSCATTRSFSSATRVVEIIPKSFGGSWRLSRSTGRIRS